MPRRITVALAFVVACSSSETPIEAAPDGPDAGDSGTSTAQDAGQRDAAGPTADAGEAQDASDAGADAAPEAGLFTPCADDTQCPAQFTGFNDHAAGFCQWEHTDPDYTVTDTFHTCLFACDRPGPTGYDQPLELANLCASLGGECRYYKANWTRVHCLPRRP